MVGFRKCHGKQCCIANVLGSRDVAYIVPASQMGTPTSHGDSERVYKKLAFTMMSSPVIRFRVSKLLGI